MKLKVFFRLFLLVFISLTVFLTPHKVYAQNKCGVNISTFYNQANQAPGLVKNGGWVVAIGNIGDMSGLETVFGNNINVVIRGHAGWTATFPANDQNALTDYAISWMATLHKMNTSNQAVYFMPINEPNMQGFSDYVPPENVLHYVKELNKWQTIFEQELSCQRVKLLSPMINQSHPNYDNWINNNPSGYLGDFSFYNNYGFYGASQNLYDFRYRGPSGCSTLFCENGKHGADKYDQFGINAKHFAVESGVIGVYQNRPDENSEPPRYEDSEMAKLVNGGLNGAWSGLEMFAIFSHDPHRPDDWDIFSDELAKETKNAYNSKCQAGTADNADTCSNKLTDQVLENINNKYGVKLKECDNGALVTRTEFCQTVGEASNIRAEPFTASRFIDPQGQTSKSLTDPVWFTQNDSLAEYETEKDGLWGADFINFNGLTIPWAQEITKFLAGPFVYQGSTAIRRTLDQGNLTQLRPLTDLTPKQVQDQLRLKYWEGCSIDNDICHPDLLCHQAVIDKSYECHENEGPMTPCVGEASNECLLSNGKEIPKVIPKPPVGGDGKIDYWSAEYKVWHDQYSSLWAEVPLYSNPITKTKKAITIATCNYESSSGTTETYTPWMASLKEVSTFLNTMLSPAKTNVAEQNIDIGYGYWTKDESGRYCAHGPEENRTPEASHLLSSETDSSFTYEAIMHKEGDSGGLLFRTAYDPTNPHSNFTNADPTKAQFYLGYAFALSRKGWKLWKAQTTDHCNEVKADCNCVNNLCTDKPGTGCDCKNNIWRGNIYLEALDDPLLLSSGAYSGGGYFQNGQSAHLKVHVTNVANGSVLIEMLAEKDGYTIMQDSYLDDTAPFLTGGYGISMYRGEDTCFSQITYNNQVLTQELKEPFFKQAYQLIKDDYNNFKTSFEKRKNKLILPIRLAQTSWQENEGLPRYQKIEKALLASSKLLQPNNNLLAANQSSNVELKIHTVDVEKTTDSATFTVNLGMHNYANCDGHLFFTVNSEGTITQTQWDSSDPTQNPFIIIPQYTRSPFTVSKANGPAGMNYTAYGDNCPNDVAYLGCTFYPNGDYNCNGAVAPPPPAQPAPPAQPQICLPPDTPEYKPGGPSDPVIAEGHSIFNPGAYHLKGEWIDIVRNGIVVGVKCRGKCSAEYKEPVWARVKYPFVQQAYNQLSNLDSGLFAKFLPYVAPEYQPEDWDVAGESQINYCIRQMNTLPAYIPGRDKYPDNAELHPYPNGAEFDNNAVCNGETRDLKAYPKFIGGIANAWQWLSCTLNPADAYCQYYYDYPNQQTYPTPTPSQNQCLPWSHFCAGTQVEFRNPNDKMTMSQQDLIDYVTDGSHWPESNINTKIDDEFIANAESAWQNAILKAQTNGLPVLTQLRGFAASLNSFKDKTWLEFVIAAAERHNWSPRFVTALWIEESGASAYGHFKDPETNEIILVEDLGCGGHDENLAKNLTCLFTNFDTNRFQSSDWEQFLLTYASTAEASKGCFQEHPNFPRGICWAYHFLMGEEPPEISDLTTDVILVGDSSYLWGDNYIAQAVRNSFNNKTSCDVDKIIAPNESAYNNNFKIWDPDSNSVIKWTMEEIKKSTDNGHQAVVLIGFGANESKNIASNKKSMEEFSSTLNTVIQKARDANALVVLATPLKGCPGPGGGRGYLPERGLKDMADNIKNIASQNSLPLANNYQAFKAYQCPSSQQGRYPSSGCGTANIYYQCLDDETPELCCPTECLINVKPYRSEGFEKRQCKDDYAHPNKTGFEVMGNTISNAIESLGVCQ